MFSSNPALWLRAHQPVLDELHRVERSIRVHAREVERLARELPGRNEALQRAIDELNADRDTLTRVCNVLTHVVPPPGRAASARFGAAVTKFRGVTGAQSLGQLVTAFEDGSADLRAAEAELTTEQEAAQSPMTSKVSGSGPVR